MKTLTKPIFFILCCILFVFAEFNEINAIQLNAGQQNEITGTVTDGATGEPLPGVSIIVKGTAHGTITDLDGNYAIKVDPGSALIFSFLGYLDEEVVISDQTTVNISLEEDVIGLEEIIVTGYGVQKKSDVTGSIASVSSEQIEEVKISSVDQALQGLAAGVNIIPRSGRPGESAVIQIRGLTSINGSDPIVIVDGVKGNFENVSPSDIQSIEVLKDASSAAIYGASGGNGVIIITTKKGSASKIRTNVNFYRGIEKPVSKLDLMNSEQWIGVVEEIQGGDVAYTGRPDTMPNYDWQNIVFEPAITQNYDISTSGGNEVSTFLISASYNNQEGIIRSSNYERLIVRINSEHKITKRLTFDEKVSYTNQKNFGLPDGRWSEYYDGPIRQSLIMPPNVPDYDPNISNYNAEGDIKNPNGLPWGNSVFGRSNPLAMLDMIDRVAKRNNFTANIGLTVNIVKGLTFTSRAVGSMTIEEEKEYRDAYDNTLYDFRRANEVKLLTSMDKYHNYTIQQLLNYTTSISDKHNISLFAGMEAYREWSYDYYGQRDMAPQTPDYLQYYSQALRDTIYESIIINGSALEERSLAYIGRLNYNYAGKYLLTFNIRRDSRSSFGPENRIGIFPAFSLGWKFSEENFIKNIGIISFGKLRFGYGQTGMFPRTGTPYASIIRTPLTLAYPYNNMSSSVGAAPIQIANPAIHWEKVHMSNFGIDLGLLENRINLTVEYYQKINEGMLMLQEVPYPVGTFSLGSEFDDDETAPEVNLGSVKNSGLEFTVGYKNQVSDLKYGVDFNLSTLKNEVLDLATDSLEAGGVHNVRPINLTRIGGSIAEFWGYRTDGLFRREDATIDEDGNYVILDQPYFTRPNGDIVYAQPKAQPGDVRYIDEDGDGRVLRPEDRVSLGSPLPKLVFGFSFNVDYKGFDLIAQFNGTWGNKIFNGTKQYFYYYHELTNRYADYENRYVDEDIVKADPVTGEDVVVLKANRDTDMARHNGDNYLYVREFFIEDGSYLRLKNLTLGYTLPQKLTQPLNIEKLRVYIGGRNIMTLTKYTGINPEVGDTGNPDTGDSGILDMGIDDGIYPVTKMLFLGANLTF
ncbi:SusC/RagA family TonB-linked outer membrane protein [Bacteroidota bacterium]